MNGLSNVALAADIAYLVGIRCCVVWLHELRLLGFVDIICKSRILRDSRSSSIVSCVTDVV